MRLRLGALQSQVRDAAGTDAVVVAIVLHTAHRRDGGVHGRAAIAEGRDRGREPDARVGAAEHNWHRHADSVSRREALTAPRREARRTLAGGHRRRARVALVEVKPPESGRIMREFPRQIPAGAQFFVRLGLVEPPGGPDQFEAAADRLTLIRIEPLPDAVRSL